MIGFFNGQTEYNYLENSIGLYDYIDTCFKYGYDFITITDINLHGYYKFYNYCIKCNIKPIIGLKIKLSNTTILGYAKEYKGLKNLFKISSLLEEKEYIEDEELFKLSDNIFFVTTSQSSINNYVLTNDYQNAKKELERFSKLDLYIGVDRSYCDFYKDNNLRILPILNARYLNKEDYNVYQTLIKIGNHKEVEVTHIFDKQEYNMLFKDMNFNLEFINDINYDAMNEVVQLPIFNENVDSKLFLKELSIKGLKKRLQINNKVKLYDDYLIRLNYELNIIDNMKYNDYFLIVWDLIKFSKQNGILVGPGRGSAAGSLVCYCLGIIEIDPLEYDLYFERFLNPSRITLPDIDIDFPDNKRDEVIKYVKEKYSVDNVCYISAFNTFSSKSSIRDICRVNNVNVDHANLMLKYLEEYGFDETYTKYESREDLIEVLTIANKMNGLIRHISTHAAGIILSSVKLDENIPLRKGINGIYQSQLESTDLEKKGYLKIDFLGIRNLALVDNITKKINIKLNDIKLDDKKTFELFQNADTNGIFQLESQGIKNVLRKMKPNNFNDIVSILALYRPGPMQYIDLYIERKEKGNIIYITKELEPILKNTYGIIVYQEQIMEIANVIAGYSYADADLLRRAISKKNKIVLDENREKFVSMANDNGFEGSISNEIYDLIVKFADYGFNKSHSVAYATLSYQMAYLKANFPMYFIAEMINNSIGDKEELSRYIDYAKSKGIVVVTPKINHSTDEVLIIKNKILLPLQVINKLGLHTTKLILKERVEKFNTFEDFKSRTTFLNESNIENLVNSCALDEFKITKKEMLRKQDDLFSKYLKDKIDINSEYDFDELKQNEYEALGFNLNYNLFVNNAEKIKKYKVIDDVKYIKENSKLNIVAYVDSYKEIETKNKEQMAFLNLDLNFIKMSAVIFPSNFESFKKIDLNLLIKIEVVVQKRNDEFQLIINKIVNI